MENQDFLKELQEFMLEEDTKELAIKITGEEDQYKTLIDSPDKANYFLKLIANKEKEIESINEAADKELAKIQAQIEAFRESSLRPLQTQKEFYNKSLESYTLLELEGTKKRSIKLPYGTLQLKKNSPKFVYDDEVILEWAKSNEYNSLISTTLKEAINKKEIKSIGTVVNNKLIIDDVELPGITIEPQEDSFKIVQ